MDEVLEALERLKTAPSFMGGTVEYQCCTNSETPLMQDYEIVRNAILELKSIKEANPSEALECLEKVSDYLNNVYDYKEIIEEVRKDINTIKQALLKAQEPKKYLKWEDLEFKEKAIYKRVTLNGELYLLKTYRNFILGFDIVELEKTDGTILFHINQYNLQFFNDLHLEMVEE